MSGPPAPKVSILCTAYNHGAYIRAALEGFVSQETDFPFEVIVHDDASTDDTADIIREYEQRYPQIVRPIYQTENQYSKERGRVTRLVHEAAQGTYWAMCEGDDYWLDPHKLKDQVAMLEADASLSACFSDAWSETDGVRTSFQPDVGGIVGPRTSIGLDDLLMENFIPTATLVMRRDRVIPLPPELWNAPAGDWIISVHLARQGRIAFLDRKTAVRRRHAGGVISMKHEVDKGLFTVACLKAIREMVPPAEQAIIDERVNGLNRTAIELAYQKGGRDAALKVWGTFKGRGFDVRQRWRWWMLLHSPGLMRLVGRLRGRR
ncbi:MAG: glycosyltransferase [Flavobacteriales bacterium]|nr:glycosyltransferase [Flavobacteriales bacterium]